MVIRSYLFTTNGEIGTIYLLHGAECSMTKYFPSFLYFLCSITKYFPSSSYIVSFYILQEGMVQQVIN